MKRFISIILLLLVLLNATGYYGLLFIVRQQLRGEAEQKIERNGTEMNGNMIFRIPLSIPYADNTAYTRTDGQVAYEGKLYRLVKQKRYNDTLYIVCVLDHKGTLLEDMLSRCTRSFTNEPKDQEGGAKIVLPVSKYYLLTSHTTLRKSLGQHCKRTCFVPDQHYVYSAATEVFQPPQRITA